MNGAGTGRDRFVVLALDGGGAKGIFTAAVLAQAERLLGVSIVDHVDLVAGTSTGGLVALGLGAGRSPSEIFETYEGALGSIFPPAARRTFPATLTRSKYDPGGLRSTLRAMLGDAVLESSVVPLSVPTFDLLDSAPHVFRTTGGDERDRRVPMWHVGMATSAAPTFFPPHRIPDHDGLFIDGGIWANNPSMVGVIDAVDAHGAALTELQVVAIGPSSRRPRPLERRTDGGLIQWGRSPNYAEILFLGQTRAVADHVSRLLPRGAVVRVEAPAPRTWTRLDAADLAELRANARVGGEILTRALAGLAT